MALPMSVQFPVTSPFPSPTKAGHPRTSVLLKPPRVSRLSLSHPKLKPLNPISLRLRLKAIEETRETPESETQQTESESESQPGGEVGSEIKEAMRKRKEEEQQEGEGGLWSGVAEEIGEIEWPPFGKVLGTTGVVLGVIAGSSVVLLTVNAVLAELSDRVFAGRGVQDFFG
ncbi:hypothetical protein ACJW30_02G013700 [Castanea mollissima]